jgi:predicted MFS family arabinose efflux permease
LSALPQAAPARKFWTPTHVFLLFLSLCYFFAYFDRLLLTVVDEKIRHEFGLSDQQLGLLKGFAFVFLYGLFGIPMGWLGDHFSRKKIIAAFVALWSSLTMLCGLAGSFWQLALARAGVGIGESPIVPVGSSAIADMFPPAKRSMAMALFYGGGMLGILACFLLGSWVAEQYGWRTSFLIAGPPGVLLAIAIALWAQEPPRAALPVALPGQAESRNSFLLVWRNKPLVWQLVASATATFVNTGIITWFPNFFIRSHGLSIKQVGLFFGPTLAIGMLVGMLAGGWVGNRLATRSLPSLLWFTATILLVIVPVYLFIFWTSSLPLALAATFIGTALSVFYVGAQAAAWQTVCHPRARASAAGMHSFVNTLIGGGALPWLVGVLSDRWNPVYGETNGLRYALMCSMAIVVLAAALFMHAARVFPKNLNVDNTDAKNSAT